MKNKTLPILIIIIFISIFFIFFKGLKNLNIYTPKSNSEIDIPSFKTKVFDTDNEMTSEEVFKNNEYYLMNIWASWCLPCRDEHAFLMKLSKQKSIEIVGLNYKDNDKKAKNFLEELDNPYKIILSDKDGTIAIEWGAYGVPETFIIHDKKIIKKIIGPINDELFLEIKRLIQ